MLNEESLKQRLKTLIEDEAKDEPKFRDRLHEKGVEVAILVPIMEVLCGFDALKDLEYESASTSYTDERFDFLLDGCFLIEAKPLKTDLKAMKKQIEDYIRNNENINYGIFSNGYEFMFFMQKSYIKGFLPRKDEELRVPIKKDVLPVLSIRIDEEEIFIDVMKLFHKNEYKTHFENIASFVLSCYNQGKVRKITSNKELNEFLKKRIKDTVDVQTGVYLNDIKTGKYSAGDTLVYEGDNITITIEILHDGRVQLNKGDAGCKIKEMSVVMNSEFKPAIDLVLNEWAEQTEVFNNPMEIIRKAQGKKKLHNQEKYQFKKRESS